MWIISDTHWGHDNILHHCRRPADSDDRSIANWRRLVVKDDLVIHLGDVAWGFYDLSGTLWPLPGTKVLVRGNHDGKTKTHYRRSGFAFVCDAFEMGTTYFTHEPAAFLPVGCTVNVHGHLHNAVPEGYRKFPHCRLYALEYENYGPVILEKFLRRRSRT
jgi:calcineurin-like phosphoesterase family protein